MKSPINSAFSAALSPLTTFNLLSILILATTALTGSSTCAMEHPLLMYKATMNIQDGANTAQKECSILDWRDGLSQDFINGNATQCAIVCNALITRNPEFRALMQDNSACIWQQGAPCIFASYENRNGTLSTANTRLGHKPSKLFVAKSLCEHGKVCTDCQDKDGWTFKKRIRAVSQDDGTVQDIPTEILCFNKKKKLQYCLPLNTLCRMYRHNDNVADLNDQDIATMANHYCNKIVTQMTLLGIRKNRRGTLLNSYIHRDVLQIICGYIKRATPEQVAADTRLERHENPVQAPVVALEELADQEVADHRDEVGAIDCVVQ